ncbi:uncharacterized protein LOC130645714 isoform X1 [Hydractinia symbiolongicarpus]|uniref:uncharacterized protein LOC130645714 isoform X1 n=1 Tax=Hydractinia symbiolongicarpus TaxID=13093 RepID=UPI00254EA105|nr:uncharacterized protein LOC130645714 isoform X1 [Hydractinia symbiolongicarpus]
MVFVKEELPHSKMKLFLTVLFCCLIGVRSDCFFEAASKLKSFDKLLCGRLDPKKALIRNGISLEKYEDYFETFKSNGTEFSCGYTRDWLMEMAFGIKNNFNELKNNLISHAAAGYVDATGAKLRTLFDSKLGSTKRIFYEMQIVGPLDHVWLIEQLADGHGYRVYQSYNGAYSLYAWMNTDASKFSELWDKKEIIYWQKVYDQAAAFLKSKGLDIEKLDNLPSMLDWMKPWLTNIKKYNKTDIIENLKRAWKNFGAGKTVSKKDFYEKYLLVLANMTEQIKPLVNTSKTWTQKLHDQWINLFASPNPLCYPDVPFNTLTATLPQDYKLEVKVVEISNDLEKSMSKRANILKKSVNYEGGLGTCDLKHETKPMEGDCFFKAANGLKVFDKLLCGRLDPKKALVANGISYEKYADYFDTFKSNGTEFSCGYTRDWLMEMAFGMKNNYNELKNNLVSHAAAGYVDATGAKLRTLFDSKLGSSVRTFYEMQIVGPLDHVWLIEQLPDSRGYRVYQSYNGAYSLYAWMNTDASKFSELWDKKEIIYWQKVYDQAAAFLKSKGLDIEKLDNLPSMLNWMKPWLTNIKKYNKTGIIENLKKAWMNFGAGKTVSQKDFYEKYLLVLADMTEQIKPLVNTSKPWTQKLHDQWINLFASPNPLCYPDVPFNTLTATLPQDYKLEVKVVEIDMALEFGISKRANVLKKSVNYTGKLGMCMLNPKPHPKKVDCYFDAANKLKKFDKLLCGRLDPKKSLIQDGISLEKYQEYFSSFKANGTEFSCGYTRDWLLELAVGLKLNYEDLKDDITRFKGYNYKDATGMKVKMLFDSNLGSNERILYAMQIVGPLDHVWLIEQLGDGAGYRVYQSYNGAYSLYAWMNTDESKFSELWDKKEIIYWQKVYDQAAAFLQSKGFDIKKLDNLPSALDWMKPWLTNIKAYDKNEIIGNLKKAWTTFGAGKTLSQSEFYDQYLMNLADMTEQIKPLVNTSKPWTQKLHDQWINLFASPNPLCYPDVPFNTLTATLPQDYRLEIKTWKVSKEKEKTISKHAKVLKTSANYNGTFYMCDLKDTATPPSKDCFFDAANGLKSYDKLLCGRLDPKYNLINDGITYEKYAEYFKNFKSNGTEFSCGYTRDWLIEMARGLKNNYDELKNRRISHAAAGYVDATGDKLKDLFNSKLGSSQRIFYEMQIVGPLDHVWLIEQLANGAGYRVYQSYNGAYSLYAWMNTDANKFSELWDKKEIIYWQKVYDQAAAFLQSKGLDIEKLDNLPSMLNWMKPWLTNIKKYNKTGIIENLKKAWVNFGAGKTLSQKDFYEKYLLVLGDMTEKIKPLVNTSKPWTQKLHDQWINLFASPNPLCYPDVPFDTLTATLPQDYKLEVKVAEMNKELEDGIAERAAVLKKSVGVTGKLGSCQEESSAASYVTVSFMTVYVIAISLLCNA